METDLFTLASFVLFTALVGIVSYRITHRAKDVGARGYFMASGGLSGWFIAGSMMLTNLSVEQLVGLNGDAYAHNLSAMAWECTAALSTIALALFFLPRYLRGGFTTLPQFLEERYDARTRRIVSALFIVGYTLVVNPSGLYLGAITFNQIFGVQALLGLSYPATITLLVVASGVIGALYAVFGGLRGVAVSDTINGIGLLIAGLMIPVLGLVALGHGDLHSGLQQILAQAPEKLNAIGGGHDSVPFGTLFTGMIFANLFYWCTNQSIVQRTLAAKSLAEGQKGVLLSGLMKLLVPVIMLVPGVIAYHLYASQPLTRPDLAYPTLVATLLPFWAKGFFVAVLFGTVMSHFNAVLNSTATLIAYDFYKPWRPQAADAELIRVGKRASVAIAVLSLLIAPLLIYAPDGIYAVMRRFTGFFNIPIIAVVLMGMFDRTVGARPAKIVLVAHVAIYALLVFVLNVDKRYGLHFIHLMGILFVAEVALMFALRKRFARAVPYAPVVREHADAMPWRYARSMSTLLVALLVSVYLTFSPLGLASSNGPSAIYPFAMAILWSAALVLAWAFARRRRSHASALAGAMDSVRR
ncbi:solute:sodium symporter family transporter [Burkholderia multivorans]|uniref:solute:sodium symporter family transporter n=1 Tax=Burkholderia multivorans TaxID=87883 RepID=UPI0019D1D3C2|nr:solute:sodium symporter family transporter [Burkholderia multivorans]MBN6738837.1 solute:sodium symporter family transporter [Burkholderia multivorans]